jgi:hypothetical protein
MLSKIVITAGSQLKPGALRHRPQVHEKCFGTIKVWAGDAPRLAAQIDEILEVVIPGY